MIWFKKYTLEDLNPYTQQPGLVKLLEIKISAIGDDYLCLSMPVDAKTLQVLGIMHGGATCVLVESAGSFASRMCLDADKQYAVGSQIQVNHLRKISSGVAVATCTPVHLGRQKHVWDILVHDQAQDMLFAKGELTCAVLNNN